MARARSPGWSVRRSLVRALWAVGALLSPLGCQVPMSRLEALAPAAPGPVASAANPPWAPGTWRPVVRPPSPPAPAAPPAPPAAAGPAGPSAVVRTAHHEGDAGGLAPPPNLLPVNLDLVLRLTRERNLDIAVAREAVHEAEIAYRAACESCLPDALRKDDFKRAAAEAKLWQRRVELAQTETKKMQEAAETYFDWLMAAHAAAISRVLRKYDEPVLDRAEKLYRGKEAQARGLLEGARFALAIRDLLVGRLEQGGRSAAAKLAALLNVVDAVLVLPAPILTPIDLVDTTVPLGQLVGQALTNGPGVRELEGLIAAIDKGLAEARLARCVCDWTGASLVCGRLHTGASKEQQARLSLAETRVKLRAAVEEAQATSLNAHGQIDTGLRAIDHAKKGYDIAYRRMVENVDKDAPQNVLTSTRNLTEAYTEYLRAVSAYDKAQVRLLLSLGVGGCAAPAAPAGSTTAVLPDEPKR